MTLVIRLSTPQGLVFCADSLVTTSEQVTILDWGRSGEFIAAGKMSPDSPPMLIDPITRNDRIIRDTKQNVDKISQLLDDSIVVAVAGSGNFLDLRVFDGGNHQLVVPFESFQPVVNDVLRQALSHEPKMTLMDKGKCAMFAYSIGAAGANWDSRKRSLNNFNLKMMGGGFSDETPWPQLFDANISFSGQRGDPGLKTVSSCAWSVLDIVARNLPKYCSSVNCFREFCDHEFELIFKTAIVQASSWSAACMADLGQAKELLIPSLFQELSNALKILSHCLGEFSISGFVDFSLADIIVRTWNLKQQGYHSEHSNSDFIDSLFNDMLENQQEFIDHWMSYRDVGEAIEASNMWEESQKEKITPMVSDEEIEKAGGIWAIAKLKHFDEKVSQILQPSALLGLTWFAKTHLLHIVHGSLLFEENYPHTHSFIRPRKTIFWVGKGQPPFFGKDTIGQDEIVERIVDGIDWETESKLKRDAKDYVFAASTSLAEMISTGLRGEDVTSVSMSDYRKFSNPEGDLASSFSDGDENSEEEDDTKEHASDDYDEFTITDLPLGSWSGFYTLMGQTNDAISEDHRAHFELKIEIKDGEKVGFATADDQNLKFTEIGTDEQGAIRFKMTMHSDGEHKLDSWSEHDVVGHLTEWGFNGTVNPDREPRGSLIMWSGTKIDSNVAGSSVIRDSLGHLKSTMQDFSPQTNAWRVNWKNLALETSVELAEYLMESTVKKQHFNQEVPTVGGKIKTVSISSSGELITKFS